MSIIHQGRADVQLDAGPLQAEDFDEFVFAGSHKHDYLPISYGKGETVSCISRGSFNPACVGRCRPGHSVVRATGAKRSIDYRDQRCYRLSSVAGLACCDSAFVSPQPHEKPFPEYPAARRSAGSASRH